jgi:hypothetical protein
MQEKQGITNDGACNLVLIFNFMRRDFSIITLTICASILYLPLKVVVRICFARDYFFLMFNITFEK